MPDLGPLRERNFRNLWIGHTTSALGDGLNGVALAFAVLAVDGRASSLGIVFAAFMVPRVVFLLVGGVWADRIPRRFLMIGADVVRAVALGALAVAVLSGVAELWVFVAMSVASGTASAFFAPAVIGLVPQTVSAGRLQQANALLNLSQSSAVMAGPVASGLIVAVAGSGWIFALDALSFAVSAAFLASLRIPPLPRRERASFVTELRQGWREVAERRWLVASLGAFAFGNLAFASFFVLGPVMANRSLGGSEAWGLVVGAFGLGGLAGGAIALRWRPHRPLVACFSVLLAAPLALLLLGVSPPLGVLMAGVLVFATATSITNTLWHTTLQQQVPPHAISRVSSYDWMVSLLIFPAGSALAGPLADVLGPQAALAVFAALAGIPLLAVLLVPGVRAVRRIEPQPADAAVGPVEPEAATGSPGIAA